MSTAATPRLPGMLKYIGDLVEEVVPEVVMNAVEENVVDDYVDSLGIIGRLVSLQAPSPHSVPPRISLRVGVPTNTLTKARDRVRNNPRRRWIHEWSHTHWSGNHTVSAQQIFPNFFLRRSRCESPR